MTETIHFRHSATSFYFDASFSDFQHIAPPENSFILTDDHLAFLYQKQLKPWRVLTVPSGESSKNMEIIQELICQLLEYQADRNSLLVGFGGGVVTDLAGFVAGIYKRGIRCGYVPTTILAMTDAAIGGKSGVNSGVIKNCIGVIRQPAFLFYDTQLLRTLDRQEWINGFAEVIKHACIFSSELFDMLENHTIDCFRNDNQKIASLIRENALLKARLVQRDELESGERRILNFGHTLAHAIENDYDLSHGHAVAIGMSFASKVSEALLSFTGRRKVEHLIEKYHLPVSYSFEKKRTLQNLLQDKKRENEQLYFILLQKIGFPVIQKIPFSQLESII